MQHGAHSRGMRENVDQYATKKDMGKPFSSKEENFSSRISHRMVHISVEKRDYQCKNKEINEKKTNKTSLFIGLRISGLGRNWDEVGTKRG